MNKAAAPGGYIRSLDGVRAVAILLVMSFHAQLNHFGWLGVQLFFVLSGFLITGILWRDKQKGGKTGDQLKKFWVRRSLRIFPLYFGWLIFLGLSFLFFHFPGYFPTYFPYLATYTVNYSRTLPEWQGNPLFTHLWSLAVEEQFYLFFPLVVFFLRAAWLKYFMVFFVLAAPLIRFILGQYYAGRGYAEPVVADVVYWNTLSHLDAFFMGGLIPVLSLDQKIRRPLVLLLAALVLVMVAGALSYLPLPGSGHSYLSDLGYAHGRTAHYEHVWQYTCLNLLFAALILVLLRADNAGLGKLLGKGWLVSVGRVSYGMYVFHWAVLVYLFNRLAPPQTGWKQALVFILYALVVYLLAWLSYRFFESPFLKLKERLSPKERSGSGN